MCLLATNGLLQNATVQSVEGVQKPLRVFVFLYRRERRCSGKISQTRRCSTVAPYSLDLNMTDPYKSPDSNLESAETGENSVLKSIAVVTLCSLAIEFTSWLLVPKLNALFAELLRFTGIEYWTIRLSFDLINSMVVYCIFVLIFSRYSKLSGYFLSFSCAVIGFIVFYVEIGGFKCLGNCGLPYWYDVSGFIKYFVYALISGFVANKINKLVTNQNPLKQKSM